LMIREHIACWSFGILSSAITIYLYAHVTLYLEAGLNVYYVIAGIYGWYYWAGRSGADQGVPVRDWRFTPQLLMILACTLLGLGLGHIMDTHTDSERPYIDALITVFSFLATYMEARKILSTWYYWFVLNAASIFLQIDRGLYYFSALSVFYTIMCVTGYIRWRRSLLEARKETGPVSV